MRALATTFLVIIALTQAEASEPYRVVLSGTDYPEKGVELFIAKPEADTRSPVILFVHGQQSAPRPGGRVFARLDKRPAFGTVDEGRLELMSKQGFLAASVSLPGYGSTPGPADFCGPRSQAAVRAALDYLLAQHVADRHKVVVYGVSRGAVTAGMEATYDPRITSLILVSGFYDLAATYPTGDRIIDRSIQEEAGITPEAFSQRSVLPRASMIRARVLILHGSADEHGMTRQAELLAERLKTSGSPVRLHIFSQVPHSIPVSTQWSEINPFLKSTVGR